MQNQFSRAALMFGTQAIERLHGKRVAVFGIGGVGSYAAEALVRGGVGAIDVCDDDRVCLTNLNRQLFATRKTVGDYKVDAAKARLLEINPKAEINALRMFYGSENADSVDLSQYDYVIDAVDTVSAKLELVCRCGELGVPVISAMGAGNKLDPTRFTVTDIYKTEICPLARVMRRELKKRGVSALKVVYSTETPVPAAAGEELSCKNNCVCPPDTARKCTDRRAVPASNSFVPPVVGLIIAGEVIKDLIR